MIIAFVDGSIASRAAEVSGFDARVRCAIEIVACTDTVLYECASAFGPSDTLAATHDR